jgi:uncharacterized protein
LPTPTSASHPEFSLLAKPSGAACNLACQYCFYLEKARLYPDSQYRMPDEVLKAYIKQFLHSQPGGEVTIAWQGGEPTLMGLDFFKRTIDLVKKYQKPDQQVAYSLQTNGTLLDDAWCAFFKKHNFLIGISLDGTPEMHDAYRVNKGGQGSHNLAKRGWDLLHKHGVDTNILCAVHAANALHPLETYRYFRDDLHATFMQFIPIVERLSDTPTATARESNNQPASIVTPHSVMPDQYGAFLVDIFEEWVHHDVGTVFVQSFDAALASWCHLPASVCIFQEVCGSSLILEHNGDLYSCDHFVEPAHRLGNILDKPLVELVNLDRQRKFGLIKRQGLPVYCQKCDVLFACHGECPRNRFMRTPDGEGGLNYLCPSYKLFFHHVVSPMRIMRQLLQQGRAPAEIMGI